jgi:diguanylate cyclase (GGDEF)-like protein/PAS domain S-box-containing protein
VTGARQEEAIKVARPGPITVAVAAEPKPEPVPGWVVRLLRALVLYVAATGVWMLTGAGGERVQHYLGLLSDGPANLTAVILTAAAAHRVPRGPLRAGWRCLALGLALYFVGTCIGTATWLGGRDPFPGPADVFYLAFYPAAFAGSLFLIRARAMRVPWGRLALDTTIFVVGFGAFFWFLVIRPAAAEAGIGFAKQALSQSYVALNCVLVLAFGVLLLTGVGNVGGRRISLYLLVGYTTMFLGDIVWALAKVGGGYLPGGLQDLFYVGCYVPLAAAAREQIRVAHVPDRSGPAASDSLVQGLPHVAMLVAFLVLVYFARADIGGPVAVMTVVVFVLTLLVMVRQGAILRDDARMRERRATEIVEARYASLIANASDVILIVTAEGGLRFASPAFERTFGLRPEAVIGRNLLDLWAGEDRERMAAFLADVSSTPAGAVGPVELRVDRGSRRFTLETVGSNLTDDPAVRGLALNLRDISERKALEEKLRALAFHDPLTRLANRNLFRDRVKHALATANRARRHVAVMFLDLDDFKNINDTLGHDAGDRLLQAIAQRLVTTMRTTDTVARLAGDEFAVLLEGMDTVADVQRPAGAVIAALGVPFLLGEADVRVAASVGVALSTPDSSAEELLSNADIAMYNAKAAGKNRYVLFEPQMQEALCERLRLEADIGRALANGEFFLEYQPIVDLRTRRLVGAEALARWRHPERGVLMPRQFVHLAEESGHIIEMGRWVLQRACGDWRRWCDEVAGGEPLYLALNISGRHLQQADLVRDVGHAQRESGIDPGGLVIELTESTIMHNTEANLERLAGLKALGVRLAIDDFGTGYSSLSYLHRFPIDILKIDRSFVSRLAVEGDGPELARAVVSLGETLGIGTVAEGIEDELQAAALLALGCTSGQGYLFARPCSLDQLAASSFVGRGAVVRAMPAARPAGAGAAPALPGARCRPDPPGQRAGTTRRACRGGKRVTCRAKGGGDGSRPAEARPPCVLK